MNYPGHGTATGMEFEGVEVALSAVAQGHAEDMQTNNFFSHTGSNGQSASSRINSAFQGCVENSSQSENIAWNSISNPAGFILGVPLAIYNFIYDDSCCNWGHRNLCLKQTGNNNFGDPNKIGLVGFGRKGGTNGDYFVMDYFDPSPSSNCNYNIINFGSSGACEEIITLDEEVTDDFTSHADLKIESYQFIYSNLEVHYMAGNEIELNEWFEVQLGTEFTAEIMPCTTSLTDQEQDGQGYLRTNQSNSGSNIITFVNGKQVFKRSHSNY